MLNEAFCECSVCALVRQGSKVKGQKSEYVIGFLSRDNLRTAEGFLVELGSSMYHDVYINRLDNVVKSSKVNGHVREK